MWYSCAIATTAWFEDAPWGDSIRLGPNLRFERIPDWVKHEDALKLLSWTDRTSIHDAEWALVTEYEADALGTPDPEWKGKDPRGIQQSVSESFALMDLALWLTKPANLGIRSVLHFRRGGDPASLGQYHSAQPMLIRDDEIDNVLEIADFVHSAELMSAITALNRDRTCWIAIWFLIRAVTEPLWHGRYLWQWIVLEALFGAENPNETSYRLAQRVALFTASESGDARARFRELKEAYTWRSKLVHGGRTKSLTSEKSKDLTTVVEAAIRQALNRILTNPELARVFDSKGRDEYLEELVFLK